MHVATSWKINGTDLEAGPPGSTQVPALAEMAADVRFGLG
jgi:hypothetical protein